MALLLRPGCPQCRKNAFELRLRKDDGVATVRCLACERHFLLLDSEDYWFDVIQEGYPPLARCTCQGTSFHLELEYRLREDGDVERVGLTTHCTQCRKSRRRMSVRIDYSPTKRLLTRPLVACRNPHILYDLKELTLYAQPADIVRVVDYLAERGCSLAGTVEDGRAWVTRPLTRDEAAAAIVKRGSLPAYAQIYAMPRRLKITDADVGTAKKANGFWKRNEVLALDAPTEMVWGSRTGKLYYLHFSNEFIAGQTVKSKSLRFQKLTADLMAWLGREFVTWRGANCFDNEQLHLRLFGQQYRKQAERKS